MSKLPIAVIGAGLIGITHIDRALKSPDFELVGIADPTPAAAELCDTRALSDSTPLAVSSRCL